MPDKERSDGEKLREDIAKVLEAFDKGIFIRSTKGDHDPAWAVKLLPYLVAIGRLQAFIDAEETEDGNQ